MEVMSVHKASGTRLQSEFSVELTPYDGNPRSDAHIERARRKAAASGDIQNEPVSNPDKTRANSNKREVFSNYRP